MRSYREIDILMNLREETALRLLQETLIPGTQVSRLKVYELVPLLRCDLSTVYRVLNNLEALNHIHRDRSCAPRFRKIELVSTKEKPQGA